MKKMLAVLATMVALCVLFFGTPAKAANPEEKAVVAISVDDGDRTLFDYVYPELLTRNMPFTAYIIAGRVGDSNMEYVTWTELQDMVWSGRCEIGNHSYSHLDPTSKKMTYAKILADIKKAQVAFLSHGFLSVTGYAYPFGVSSAKVLKAVKAAGLTHARGAWAENDDINTPNNFNPFWIESVSYHNMYHSDLKPHIDKAVANRAGLSIVIHSVYPSARGDYELDLVELQKTLDYLENLRAQGKIEIATVSQMAGRLVYYKTLP